MSDIPRQRILLVEDDEGMVRLLRAILEMAGYGVSSVRCGTTALTCVTDDQPALVILDIGLPDMNGYEVSRKLRQYFHPWAMPILMLTGMNKPVDQLRGFASGADAYLTKPCDPPELLKTISLLLGQPNPEVSDFP